MFCPKCGDQVEQNEKYCNKCGNYVGNNNTFDNILVQNNISSSSSYNQNNQFNNNQQSALNIAKIDNKKMIFVGIISGVGLLLLLIVSTLIINNNKDKYYFSNNNYENDEQIVEKPNENNKVERKSKYSTVIVTDNTYSGVKINTDIDAYELIARDSIIQKDNCPAEIVEIENQLINQYGITAVNLCEMEIEFAKELVNVFKKIYEEYPSVKENLTNLSLVNASLSDGYIAAFMPIFNFATSDSSSTYPWVIKTQVLLNTAYFLNPMRLETSVNDGSNSGHFPPNATIYSPVAHELGHYLSFLAMMRSYDLDSILLVDSNNIETFYDIYSNFVSGDFSLLMITEAYNNYKNDTNTTLSIDDWRATISSYAVTRDNSGKYIYDETIAEAFHDVYLNDSNAQPASKYVVEVLKKKIEG